MYWVDKSFLQFPFPYLCVCEGFVRDCRRSSTQPTFADRGPALVRALVTNVTTTVPSCPRLARYTTGRVYLETEVPESSQRATPDSATHGSSKQHTELGPLEHWHHINILPRTKRWFVPTNSWGNTISKGNPVHSLLAVWTFQCRMHPKVCIVPIQIS